MNDHVLIWGLNLLLQVTLVSAFGLAIATCLRRNPAMRYGVLCTCLMLLMLSPVIALVMQSSGKSLLSVAMMQDGASQKSITNRLNATISKTSNGMSNLADNSDQLTKLTSIEPDETLESPDVISEQGQSRNRAETLEDEYGLNSPSSIPIAADESLSAMPMVAGSVLSASRASVILRYVLRPLLYVWMTGAIFLLIRLGIGWWRLARILKSAKAPSNVSLAQSMAHVCRRMQLANTPKLLLSDQVSGPISAGLRRPRVVLPVKLAEQVSSAHLLDIFVHEVAHILRRDQLMVFLQNVAGALYWLHPLANWLNRELAQAREEVCDNYVLATTDASSYSRTLLTLAELVQCPRPVAGAVGLFTSRWKLEHRVAGLLDEGRIRAVGLTNRGRFLLATTTISLAAIAGLGTVQLASGQNEDSIVDDTKEAESTPASDENSNIGVVTNHSVTKNAVTVRGEGQNREMLLRGRVLNSNGQPASSYVLHVNQTRQPHGTRPLSPRTDGEHFEVWVPVDGSEWFFVDLDVSSKDGKERAYRFVGNQQLRQASIERVELTLKKTNRTVKVTVTKDGTAVAKAHVTAQLSGNMTIHSETNDDGMATFHIMKNDKIRMLTAWTDGFQIGGYQFNREPYRDQLANDFSIELDDCQDQTIRLINAKDETPIPNLRFELVLGTGKPNYNFVATADTLQQCKMTTNEKGEAVFRWFPDWEKHGVYAKIVDPGWTRVGPNELEKADDNTLVMTLKRSAEREPLFGRVNSDDHDVTGLLVEIETFQAEEEGRVDRLYAFTDQDGRFTAPCLPGATYCVCVMDDQVVSNVIDLIPFEPDTKKSNFATLTASAGELVEVHVTSGPNREPMRDQHVWLSVGHDFTWRENGKTKSGHGGRQWGVNTDRHGIAHVRALAGTEIEATVYAGEWSSEDIKATVKANGVTKLEIHREIADEREITGRLVLPPDLDADIANADIEVGSVDGQMRERVSAKADQHGDFFFTTKAIQYGVFAFTADGKAAGVAMPQVNDESIEIRLKPTADLHGQLLGVDDMPLKNYPVRAKVRVQGKPFFNHRFDTAFIAKTFETRTDSEGNYTLNNLPTEFDMRLMADRIDDSDRESRLDTFFLRVGEERPRLVSRVGQKARKQPARPLAERYERVLRDAALGDFHLMVLVFDPKAGYFVDREFVDYSKTPEVMSFMNLQVDTDQLSDTAAAEFLKIKSWPSPKPLTVFACALDGSGTELGRIELDVSNDNATKDAEDFIRKHAPVKRDAQKKWDAAFADAKRSNRKVWARVSQRYCGPCFSMSRWLDDNREMLERDYVLLKIDDVRDDHGAEVTKRIVSDRPHFGVPFHAIFAADQKLLIDSESPTGNVGHPSGFEGRRHLTKMLSDTSSRLSHAQIVQIVQALQD